METQELEHGAEPGSEADRGAGHGAGIAWLALALALAAAASAGWQWWQTRGGSDAALERDQAMQRVQAEQANLGRQLDDLQSQQRAWEQASTEIARIDAGLAGLQARLEQLASQSDRVQEQLREADAAANGRDRRLEAVERSIAALALRGESPGKRLELAEIDFLLRNATERLQLSGDRHGAMLALGLAATQLEIQDDPLFLPVRQAIAAARLELEEMPVIDRVGLTQRLANLQSRIQALPFGADADPGMTASGEPAGDSDPGLWARFKAQLSGLVTVRRRVDENELISVEDRAYVRQGLWLQIESARLAVLRADQDAYEAALQRATNTLRQYFDVRAPQVTKSLATIEELGGEVLRARPPDISQPWTLLNSLRAAPPSPTPAPEQEPEPEPEPGSEPEPDSEPEPEPDRGGTE